MRGTSLVPCDLFFWSSYWLLIAWSPEADAFQALCAPTAKNGLFRYPLSTEHGRYPATTTTLYAAEAPRDKKGPFDFLFNGNERDGSRNRGDNNNPLNNLFGGINNNKPRRPGDFRNRNDFPPPASPSRSERQPPPQSYFGNENNPAEIGPIPVTSNQRAMGNSPNRNNNNNPQRNRGGNNVFRPANNRLSNRNQARPNNVYSGGAGPPPPGRSLDNLRSANLNNPQSRPFGSNNNNRPRNFFGGGNNNNRARRPARARYNKRNRPTSGIFASRTGANRNQRRPNNPPAPNNAQRNSGPRGANPRAIGNSANRGPVRPPSTRNLQRARYKSTPRRGIPNNQRSTTVDRNNDIGRSVRTPRYFGNAPMRSGRNRSPPRSNSPAPRRSTPVPQRTPPSSRPRNSPPPPARRQSPPPRPPRNDRDPPFLSSFWDQMNRAIQPDRSFRRPRNNNNNNNNRAITSQRGPRTNAPATATSDSALDITQTDRPQEPPIPVTASSSAKVQGGTLKTWAFTTPNIERVHILCMTEGRPLSADIDLWNGPDNAPVQMSIYSQSGLERPFSAVIETPGGDNALAIRNTATIEFPLAACVEPEAGRRNAEVGGYGKPLAPLADVTRLLEDTAVARTIQGGAVWTRPFRDNVSSVQVMLRSSGRPMQARIELIQGPNNDKQVIQVYSQNGVERPVYFVLESPGAANVVRIVNTAPVEYPLAAYAEPYVEEPVFERSGEAFFYVD